MWAAVIVGIVLAPVTAYCSWRVARKGPYFYDRNTRIVTYAMYHLYWLYPLIVFIVLTAMHAQSARLPATAPPRDEAEGGLYLPAGVFDLETLACGARALADQAGRTSAADRLGRVCVGETATRWLTLPIALLTAGLALLLELDRRGARRCIAVAENVRSAW
ncbi:uncharacterized protein PG998_006409 [Apiospora kogelbergensis]|uniref:uncharacterized protein n=1 Tax=Apiospora kogelbergensis TaxID=1337665 RepID=UPI00312F41E7